MPRRPSLYVLARPDGLAGVLFWGLLLSLLPLLDGYVLILLSRVLGVYLLLAAVAATGLVGVLVVLAMHRTRVDEARAAIEAGRDPSRGLGQILVLAVAAVCLIIPGFATDAIGIALLLPPCRWLVGALLARVFRGRLAELCEYLRAEEW